ncbi:hypothetical protein PT974_00005 [Cladobotryum mycophilum]|uniref:Uncharacterized protein n=1 Tax=Cladobotryum mycophilum TaxID=491253 RepID=A0ABR0S8W7_9HYPO
MSPAPCARCLRALVDWTPGSKTKAGVNIPMPLLLLSVPVVSKGVENVAVYGSLWLPWYLAANSLQLRGAGRKAYKRLLQLREQANDPAAAAVPPASLDRAILFARRALQARKSVQVERATAAATAAAAAAADTGSIMRGVAIGLMESVIDINWSLRAIAQAQQLRVPQSRQAEISYDLTELVGPQYLPSFLEDFKEDDEDDDEEPE